MGNTAILKDRYLENVPLVESSRELLSLQLQSSRLAPSVTSAPPHIMSNCPSVSNADGWMATWEEGNAKSLTKSVGIEDIYTALLAPCKTIGQTQVISISQRPDRILDAPGLQDDFYLNTLDFSARNVLGVGLGSSVYLWNGVDGTVKELVSLPGEGSSYVASLQWIHDGRSIALGLSNGSIQIWDVEKCRKLRTMIASPGYRVAALASHRHILSSGSRNGLTANHDVRAAKHLVDTLNDGLLGKGEVCGLRWDSDGENLAAGTNDNYVHVWGSGSSRTHRLLEGHTSAVKALAWCPWKKGTLATGGGSQDRTIRLWNVAREETTAVIDAGGAVSSLLWSHTGSKELVSTHGLEKNNIALWCADDAARNLSFVGEIEGAHDGRILHCCAAPNGGGITTASSDESIKFWSIFSKPRLDRKSLLSSGGKSSPCLGASISSPFSLKTRSFR